MNPPHWLAQRLAVLTPSYIGSRRRHDLAQSSVQSLRRVAGSDLLLIVVHDSPARPTYVPSFLYDFLPAVRWDRSVENIYSHSNTRLIRRTGRGSASAMREAVAAAGVGGVEYGFIHLDDHVYQEGFRELLEYGIDALETDPDLLWVRYSGYPIICNDPPRLGLSDGKVTFDTVTLNGLRNRHYTLWWSALDSAIIRGRYWPVAMWFCVYRLPVLALLLDWAIEHSMLHLANLELYLKQTEGFSRLQRAYPTGKFGYINMQYGGIEMHRNANWRELLRIPNDPIL